MAKIIIDNRVIECRDGIPVLQAAIEAGWDVPHYCYHPGLSVVASCRLCLMEMMAPNPKTQELSWSPKLAPSCQTPVKDGLVCRFDSDKVRDNQKDCMEYFLLNHPLDCPVCDQAGECYLQDYSYKFGSPVSRMVDQKLKNPKKDIGPRTLLYQDRCVMCTRCVRFADEVSGTHELCVVNRGTRAEIDVFPGFPLDNPLQGNVVDLCPVGSLLDKDFLFKRRVWELKGANSVCTGCSTGCSIRIDHADNKVYRLKPRYNPKVNQWWMCDEGRFGWKYIHNPGRITAPLVRRGLEATTPNWSELPEIVRVQLAEHVRRSGDEGVAVLLSPFLACEEAWLIIRIVQQIAPRCTLIPGPVPTAGEDLRFPVGAPASESKFRISKEKCPNRRGIETLIEAAGGKFLAFAEFATKAAGGSFNAAWITSGYPQSWVDKELAKCVEKVEFLIVQDMFENELTRAARIVLPACAWAEREGSFMNDAGLVQPFDRAIDVPDGAKRDGQYLYEIAGFSGLYRGDKVRTLMSETIPAFCEVYEAPAAAEHAH